MSFNLILGGVFLFIFISFLIVFIDKRKTKKLLENYDPLNDESRKAEENSRELRTGFKEIANAEPCVTRPGELKGRELLSSTTPISNRKDCSNYGSSNKLAEFFESIQKK